MKLNTCPNHPGNLIETHPCPKCGHPQVVPEGREPYRSLWLVKPENKGEPMKEQTSTQALDLPEEREACVDDYLDAISPHAEAVPECYGTMAAKDDDECGVCKVAAACATIVVEPAVDKIQLTDELLALVKPLGLDLETGELTRPGQLLLGLDLPALTQRKGQTPGMTRYEAIETVRQAIGSMKEGDRVTVAMKDGGVIVKVIEAWRAE